jgi:2-oxoglutarate ferredoxin oxidoreductase subunit gamma
VALSQEAYTKFRPQAGKGAQILIDADLVTPFEDDQVLAIPATRMAEDLGKRIVANMIMLGFFTAVTGLASRESMQQALETSVKSKTVPLNLQAFKLGYEYQGEKEHVA